MQRYTVEDVGRIYVDDDDRWYASVSTVLDHRPKPDALVNWLENTEDADEINRFKRNRGTLIHYHCLNPLFQESTGDEDADMWSEDEESSKQELQAEGKYAQAEADIEWATDTFDRIRELHHMDHILDVETYVKHVDVGFAGQFDLLYQDQHNDETVLADIKTGKAVYDKNQDQLAAYAYAVPIEVDRVEVLRLNPDNRDWEISMSHDIGYGKEWTQSVAACWDDFVDTYDSFAEEELEEVKSEIRSLVEQNSVSVELEQSAY